MSFLSRLMVDDSVISLGRGVQKGEEQQLLEEGGGGQNSVPSRNLKCTWNSDGNLQEASGNRSLVPGSLTGLGSHQQAMEACSGFSFWEWKVQVSSVSGLSTALVLWPAFPCLLSNTTW